ncbi:sensor histidine kinase [Oceanospirillum sanctuarii]|uniref:sensor histidine kinase n=1 Tax=Oceanospirillum sanctuarii TaxID=1434821 RepID=UPI000A370773|nr:ATP-binding protein [Oceanospirillum sanctuarii]
MQLSNANKLSRHPFASIIGRRIIIILVIISSLITFISTIIQLYGDYRHEVSAVETRFQELKDVHVESLTINLWEFNERQLNIRLEGLVKLPDISFIKVTSATGSQFWQAGSQVEGDKISQLIPLEYSNQDSDSSFMLGQLYVESSSDRIYQQLLETFLSLLITNGIKTFIVSALILWVFQLSVNRRITGILGYLDHFRPNQRHLPLELEQTPFVTSERDEISVLALSINQLSHTLNRLYEEIETERDRFTDFANAASDWLWETDEDDKLIFASEQMLLQMGLIDIQAYNRNFIELIPNQALIEAIENRHDFKGLEVKLSIAETERIFVFNGKVVKSESQSAVMRGSAIEITSQKRAEQALQDLNETLEKRVVQRTLQLEKSLHELEITQNQLIEREKMASLASLISGIAHEINTPLGVAITAGSMLEPTSKSDYNYEAYKLMQDNLQRVVRLVQVFKQTAAQNGQNRVESVYVKQLLSDVIVGLQQKLQKKQISVQLECEDNLNWPTITQSWVQIFHQMIDNSIIHGFEEANPDNLIRISIIETTQGLTVCYEDNGAGMPKDALNKIFEPFHTTKRNTGCTGLGMHIVYNQVSQALTGSIQAESEPGQGLKIKIQLPPLPETLSVGS